MMLIAKLMKEPIMHGTFLFFHVLSATIWTGGHLFLALIILPRAVRYKTTDNLKRFESDYEIIGISALLIQVCTGVWLAYEMIPNVGEWLSPANPVSQLILAKLGTLALTAAIAADARLRIIPRLSAANLTSLALHIVPVTILSVVFVFIGVSFRTGWFY